MKTHHHWKESIVEKTYFMSAQLNMNTTQYNERYPVQNTHRPVTFFCAAPRAQRVMLAGDFNDWQPLLMNRSVDGWWQVQVELPHGQHRYHFLVDGQPMLDPHATGIVRDE